MHAIKGGWVGQTFALAKCNDSGGKKSRIRRSKEERKSLVESFIKTHHKLNNGSFPSLNLTHKEVGGSFYTVREIVREVIQENKVLGPGNPDEIFEQHLIGSFSVETEKKLSSADGYPTATATRIFPHHITSEELVPSANLEDLGDGLYLNGSSEIFQNNEQQEQAMAVISEDRENLVLEEGVEDTEAANIEVSNLESGSMVEIPPLSYVLDDSIGVLNGNSGEKVGHISAVDGVNFLQNGSNLRNELNNASLEDLQLSFALVDENEGKIVVPVEENLDKYEAKEGSDIVLNYHEDGSEKPVLNPNTQRLENGHQNFGEGLENSGLGKASEKNEEHEDMCIDFGDEEISELEGKSNNGGVVNEILGKGEGESSVVNGTNFLENGSDLRNELNDASLEDPQLSYDLVDENVGENEVIAGEILDNFIAKEGTDIFQKYHQDGSEEPVLNASTQNLENEHQSFDGGLEFSELCKASEKNEEDHEDMHIGSGDEEISKLEGKSINEVIMNENLGIGEGESSVVDGMNFLVSGSDLRNELNDATLKDPQLSYDLVDEKVRENKVPVEENLHNYMAKEGTDIFLNRHQDGIEEPVLISNTHSLDNEHRSFGEGLEISGLDKASEKNEEHEDMRISSGDDDISELEEKSSNGSVLNENLGKGEGESSVVDETNFQESAADLTDARKIAKIAVQQLENCWDLVTENPESIVEVPLEEISKVSMVEEGTGLDIRESFETEDENASVVGIKITDLKNGVNTQSSKNTNISSEQTIPKMAIATINNQLVDDLKKANQTLDRINLESWKTNSDKNQKQPTNPLLVYFKAFITAFVKFWSE